MQLRYIFGFGIGIAVTISLMVYGALQPGASVFGVLLVGAIGVVAVPLGVFLTSWLIDRTTQKDITDDAGRR